MNTRPTLAVLIPLALIAAGVLVPSAPAQDAPPATKLDLPIASGPFAGTMDSLTNPHCPDWFRDAQFRIRQTKNTCGARGLGQGAAPGVAARSRGGGYLPELPAGT